MSIKIDFEFDTKHGLFRDALNLDDDHQYTQDEIDAMKQARVDNWITFIETPPVESDVLPPDYSIQDAQLVEEAV